MTSVAVRGHRPLTEAASSGLWDGVSGWALAGAAALLLLVVVTSAQVLADPDTQWHIATGRLMLEARAMLREDVLSHTFAGAPWIAKEWLAQVVLAAAYLTGGWAGVVLITGLSVAATGFLVHRFNALRDGPAAGAVLAMVMTVVIASTIVARPHVLVFPIIAAWTIALVASVERDGRPPWLALPLLALWANLHAGFTMGVLVAAGLGLEAVLRARPDERLGTFVRWALFGAGCVLAVIATPHGLSPLLLNVQMAGGNEAMAYIGEWRSPAFGGRWLFLAGLLGAAIYALSGDWRSHLARIGLLAVLGYAMLRHERFVMVFGIVAPVVAGPALWRLARDASAKLGVFRDGFTWPAAATPARVAGGLIALSALIVLVKPPALPAAAAPVAALASVPAEVRASPVFNSYNLGGFLAFNGVKTYIDGRTDQLFLGGFISRMMTATEARGPDALAALLDERAIQWAIIAAHTPETRHFPRLPNWRLSYKDEAAQVWVRDRAIPAARP